MNHFLHDAPRWPLVDLLVLLAVVLSILGALRRGSGPLAAAGSGLGALVVAWLALVAVAAWAPGPLAAAADRSAVLHAVPAPHRALAEAGTLADRLLGTDPPSRPTPIGDQR